MANVCYNEIHISCSPQDVKTIKDFMNDNFYKPDCFTEDVNSEEAFLEFYFDSKWTFPDKTMNELLTKLKKRDEFYGTCLSYEWGNLYCAFNGCDEEGEWREM